MPDPVVGIKVTEMNKVLCSRNTLSIWEADKNPVNYVAG